MALTTVSGSNVSNVSRSAGDVGNPGPNTRQQDNLRYIAIQPPVRLDQLNVVVPAQNTASSGCCFTPNFSDSCVKVMCAPLVGVGLLYFLQQDQLL